MAQLWVDNAILVLITLYTLGGFFRGFKQELYSLFFWLTGMLIAWFFSQNFSIFFLKTFSTSSIRLAASYASLMILTLVLGSIISFLLGNASKKKHLKFMDRIGGLVFGPIHGLMAVLVLVLIAGLTPLPKDRWWRESIYIPPFQVIVATIKSNGSSILARSINYSNS